MDVEASLLARALSARMIGQLVSAGIESRHWIDPELRAVFDTASGHFRTWKSSPSLGAIRLAHPEYQPVPVTDELGYLITEFVIDRSVKEATRKLRDLADVVDKADAGDPEFRTSVIQHFMEHTRELVTLIPTSHSSRFSDMTERLITTRRQQEEGEIPGVKLGIPQVDDYVHAVRSSEVVVHLAPAGIGKSQGLIRSAMAAYEQGDNVLFFSLEMEAEEIWEIFDAQAARLSRTALRRRQLGEPDYERWERAAARVAMAKNNIIVYDDTDGAPTIDKLAARVDQHRPDTVCVDYISLMAAGMQVKADYERVMLISRALKQMARSYKVRVYAAAQSNRDAYSDGPTLDNIAFSLAIGQDANIAIGYHQDPEMAKINQMQVRLLKNRNGDKPAAAEWAFEYWDRDHMSFENWSSKHTWLSKMGENG